MRKHEDPVIIQTVMSHPSFDIVQIVRLLASGKLGEELDRASKVAGDIPNSKQPAAPCSLQLFLLLSLQDSWVALRPEHAVHQYTAMLRNVLVECRHIVLWIHVIIRLQVSGHWTAAGWSDKVLCSAQGSVELRTVTTSNDFSKIVRRHHLMRQELEDFLRPPGHFPIAKKSEGQRTQLLRRAVGCNHLSAPRYSCLRRIQVRIHVATADTKKRSTVAHCQQPLSQSSLQVDHASDTRKPSKSYQSTACAASGLGDALVVYQTDPLLQHRIQ
mmetsp:Transcript_1818/g.3963  ORF Transcript_1818/g.3963 Transcript_1818/m.3963 type:complete len:272 (+) Transcript_1818:2385-3200(+)